MRWEKAEDSRDKRTACSQKAQKGPTKGEKKAQSQIKKMPEHPIGGLMCKKKKAKLREKGTGETRHWPRT